MDFESVEEAVLAGDPWTELGGVKWYADEAMDELAPHQPPIRGDPGPWLCLCQEDSDSGLRS